VQVSPLEVNALSLEELRTHRSTKWRDFPLNVLPLHVAEMDFPVAQPIRELLAQMVLDSDLGYLGSVPEVGASFAEFSRQRWDWEIDANQVRISTDVGVGVVEVLRLFTKPGDRVLVNSPIYHNFYTWIAETHLTKVDVPFTETDSGWAFDMVAIENEYRTGIKVHMLCSPHNPLGRVYGREELQKLAMLAQEYGVTVISDEIHAPLTYAESEFIPFLSLGPVAESVGVTITAASKAWNIAGLKCAIIVTQNEKMNEKLRELPPAMHYRASLLGAFATAKAFEAGGEWLDSTMKTLDENRHFLKDLLKKNIPEVKYRVPNSSYLAWMDFSALGLGDNPTKVLLERGRVAFNGGHTFGPHTGQFVRLNFATSHSILTEAVARMVKAL
jgi:cysteine-S-conjugate beta-lyase